jgi:hypothetical protein
MNKVTLSAVLFAVFSQPVFAQLEEIVVTAGRSDGAPVVYSVKGDYHLQPIKIINDSLVEEERERDVKAAYEAIIDSSLGSSNIAIVASKRELTPIKDASDFSQLYRDDSKNSKSSINLFIKSEIKSHDPSKGTYKENYQSFINSVGKFGRTKVVFNGDSDITILNPRQYRASLIQEIGKDIKVLVQALGGDYRVVINGLDRQVKWHREGEDNVEFFIPYSFIVIPKNITMIPGEY